jgi:hypothetical protein
MTTAVFFVYAAVALGAGVVVVAARSAAVAVRALAVGLLAGCCAYVQMLAPVVAAVQLVMLAGATVAALQLAVGDEVVVPRRWLSALALVPIAGLVVLLVGTWARQFVWAGRELAAGSGFGGRRRRSVRRGARRTRRRCWPPCWRCWSRRSPGARTACRAEVAGRSVGMRGVGIGYNRAP